MVRAQSPGLIVVVVVGEERKEMDEKKTQFLAFNEYLFGRCRKHRMAQERGLEQAISLFASARVDADGDIMLDPCQTFVVWRWERKEVQAKFNANVYIDPPAAHRTSYPESHTIILNNICDWIFARRRRVGRLQCIALALLPIRTLQRSTRPFGILILNLCTDTVVFHEASEQWKPQKLQCRNHKYCRVVLLGRPLLLLQAFLCRIAVRLNNIDWSWRQRVRFSLFRATEEEECRAVAMWHNTKSI